MIPFFEIYKHIGKKSTPFKEIHVLYACTVNWEHFTLKINYHNAVMLCVNIAGAETGVQKWRCSSIFIKTDLVKKGNCYVQTFTANKYGGGQSRGRISRFALGLEIRI